MWRRFEPNIPLRNMVELVASGYEAFYTVWGKSPTLREIWREHVTGSDYPEEFAHISLLPLVQLRSLSEGLNLKRSGSCRSGLWGGRSRPMGSEGNRCPPRRH